MPEAIALHVVVLHFADSLGAQRLPREILACAPTTLPTGHALAHRFRAGPFAPRMIVQGVLAQRLELLHQLATLGHRERGRDADVLQVSAIIIEPEQQRADRVTPALVPTKSGYDAIRGARVLHFDHGALPGEIRAGGGLGDDAIEPGAFEAVEPIDGGRPIASHRRQMNRRRNAREEVFQNCAPFGLRLAHHIAAVCGENVESDERRRHFLREFLHSGRRRMQSKLQRIEFETVRSRHHDLSVEDTAFRQPFEKQLMQLGEIAIQWTQIAALNEDVLIASIDDGAKAVPFRLEEILAGDRQIAGELGEHRLDRRSNGKVRGLCWSCGIRWRRLFHVSAGTHVASQSQIGGSVAQSATLPDLSFLQCPDGRRVTLAVVVRRMDVKRIPMPVLLLSLFALSLFAAGCSDDDDPVGPGTANNFMSARINGEQWAADQSAITITGDATSGRQGTITISGTRVTGQRNITLFLSFINGPGTYPLGVSVLTNAGGRGLVTDPPNTWTTPLSGDAGSVTISTRTDSRIAGTFSFVATDPGGSTSGAVVTEGEFDITVSGGLPNLATGIPSSASAMLDGELWNAAAVGGDSPSAGEFSFAATTTEFGIAIQTAVPVSAGNTYGIPSEMDLVITLIGGTDTWHAEAGPDIGTVTVQQITDDQVVGSFEGIIPQFSGGSTPMEVTEGQFNVSLVPIEIKGRP